MEPKKVFISYSHDSPEHAARVAGLAASLRRDGVDCRIDQHVGGGPREGWRTWMKRTLKWADTVLVVCTETYLRRLLKEEKPGKGYGATYEANLIAQELCEAHLVNERFLPVFFEPDDRRYIPQELRDFTPYLLDNQKGYDDLYVTITGQHKAPRDLGEVRKVEIEGTAPLFGEPDKSDSPAAPRSTEEPAPSRATWFERFGTGRAIGLILIVAFSIAPHLSGFELGEVVIPELMSCGLSRGIMLLTPVAWAIFLILTTLAQTRRIYRISAAGFALFALGLTYQFTQVYDQPSFAVIERQVRFELAGETVLEVAESAVDREDPKENAAEAADKVFRQPVLVTLEGGNEIRRMEAMTVVYHRVGCRWRFQELTARELR